MLVPFDRIHLYIGFLVRAWDRRGKGRSSSPTLESIREALSGREGSGFAGIEELRRSLLRSREVIPAENHGAGSRSFRGGPRTVRSLVRTTSVSAKKGRLLARIAGHFNFPLMIELGTGAGISSLYLAGACPRSRLMTCEGSPAVAALARSNFSKLGAFNIESSCDLFLNWLPGVLKEATGEFLLFIDGDHRGDRVLQYCSMVFDEHPGRAMLILDDIHWSDGMHRAWKELTGRKEISLSLELFNTGILMIGTGIQEGHFMLNF